MCVQLIFFSVGIVSISLPHKSCKFQNRFCLREPKQQSLDSQSLFHVIESSMC
jgi:hypothetical protein